MTVPDWKECPPEQTVYLTGVENYLDASDIRQLLSRWDFSLSDKKVVEIGSGTGRMSQLCREYVGFDVSPGMVEYATSQGVDVRLAPPFDETGDVLLIFHVFPHISREERRAYLALDLAPVLITDIHLGESGTAYGWPLIFREEPEEFEKDLTDAGWKVRDTAEKRNFLETANPHLYYLCER